MPTFIGSGRNVVGMDRRLRELEESYEMEPQERDVERGFWQNISDFYGMEDWGDWWRGLFQREEREKPEYTVYPEWGKEDIRTLRDIMED